MDSTDHELLRRLQHDGRAHWAELASAVKLTPPAVAERVHKLTTAGVIRRIAARVDPDAVGLPLLAFVAVTLGHPRDRRPFLARVAAAPEILECHHVAGEHDFLLKVRCAGTAALDTLLSDTLKAMDGVVRTNTTIVLGSPKETDVLPLPSPKRARTRG
jgi:Lrp/AsnC family leucine-responsive transcriptional regulator